jgi:hypothetical protein
MAVIEAAYPSSAKKHGKFLFAAIIALSRQQTMQFLCLNAAFLVGPAGLRNASIVAHNSESHAAALRD